MALILPRRSRPYASLFSYLELLICVIFGD
jgi:hypothetical protein